METCQVNIEKALSIPGWMSSQELTWLASKAKECDIIVEFGSFCGRSTRALADNTDGIVYAVDPWNVDYFTEQGTVLEGVNTFVLPQFIENLREHVESGKVIPVRNFSYNFKCSSLVDMVFIDGDHRYNICKKDILVALTNTKYGGIISGHDYGQSGWPGVKQAVDEFFPNAQIEDTIWWTKKS